MTQERNLALRGDLAITPAELIELASEQSKLLMKIVDQTGCFQIISGKKYLQVEAWETIGAFNRVHAVTRQINPIVREGETVGYQADVELLKDGTIVGGASMPCFFTENACKGKEGDAKHKACMSAAQTFATSKAYRMNYSYIAILAGFQPTPAEEMTGEAGDDKPANLEHWCEVHKTKFFKRGKMPRYAHPLKEGGWCNEGEVDQGKTKAQTTTLASAKSEGIEEESSGIISPETEQALEIGESFALWVVRNLPLAKWTQAQVISWMRSKINYQGLKFAPDFAGTMDKLSPEQSDFLRKEILSRIEMA